MNIKSVADYHKRLISKHQFNGWEKALFIHIPKTAGKYIRKKFSNQRISYVAIHHASYSEIMKYHRSKEIKNIWSFAIVRDPYSRFLSACFHSNVAPENRVNILTDINQGIEIENYKSFGARFPRHFLPQHFFITENDKIQVDTVYRYEDLDFFKEDLKNHDIYITDGFEVIYNPLTKNAKSQLSSTEIKLIEEYYKKDFELFSY